MEADGIRHDGSLALLLRPKEDGGAKDALKTLNDSVVVVSVLRQFEVVEHLGRTGKADHTTLLENGQGRNPNGDEAILAEGQTKTWMGDDLQKELAVLPTMNQLPCRRAAQGESAEHKWASMLCQLLLPVRSLVADKLDCLELLEPKLRDRNRVKYLPNRYQPWQIVYTAFSVGGGALWVRIVREK